MIFTWQQVTAATETFMAFGTVQGTRGPPSSHCASALGCTQKHQALISSVLLRTEAIIRLR